MKHISSKVKNLPPYLFSKFQKQKKQLMEKGVDVIDLGIGAPDLPPPDFVIDELVNTVRIPENHRYSAYEGSMEFKEAVAEFYKQQYGVQLNPETEVLTLIGSKEGITNIMQAVLDEGDQVLIPNPGYPVYKTAVTLAGAEPVEYSLKEENHFSPSFNELDAMAQQAKVMLLNYPGNPTAATIHLHTFLEAITFAKKHDLLIVNDAAYHLVTFNGYRSPSILQAPGAKENAVEFGSLSKSFNMTGWRIGYVVGNEHVIRALSTLKSNIDSSQFLPIQKAAAKAITSDLTAVEKNNKILQERMKTLHQALNDIGIEADEPNGTIFIWAKVPDGFTSTRFAEKLLNEAGVIVTPGTAFGSGGEGYVRMAITVKKERLQEVIKRVKRLDFQEVKDS